eukprot:6478320-Amphidinium_carterae.2
MQYKARMIKADPEYWMDMQILKSLAGSAGAEALHNRFLSHLPSESETCDLRVCWSNTSAILSLESFKWASETTQGHLMTGVAMVNELLLQCCMGSNRCCQQRRPHS